MGGRISGFTPASTLLLLYMAMISAVAYSLWGLLLKYNPVSRITVFGFMNPVFGVILSALLLGEDNQAFSLYGLAAPGNWCLSHLSGEPPLLLCRFRKLNSSLLFFHCFLCLFNDLFFLSLL